MKDDKLADSFYCESEWILGRKAEKERCGAYGVFTLTNDLARYTKATLFNRTGKKTRMLLAFSEVAKCKDDRCRGRICGYSIRFHTADGIWDLTGCNYPVAFACHPQKYHDCACSRNQAMEYGRYTLTDKWSNWTLLPDSLYQIMLLAGEGRKLRNYRQMHGFSCRTYRFISKENKRFLVKFHFLSQQNACTLEMDEESELRYSDYCPSARLDLHDNIKKGNYPKWKLYLQIMPEEEAERFHFNPCDSTKIWPLRHYPFIEAGTLELHCNPQKDSQEISHCNFSPTNLVPGIELPDYTYNCPDNTGYYEQPGSYFRLQSAKFQQRLIRTVTEELANVPEHIRLKAAARFYQADKLCGKEIAKALQIDLRFILEEVEWQKEADEMSFLNA